MGISPCEDVQMNAKFSPLKGGITSRAGYQKN
jgi:hypothetical protein